MQIDSKNILDVNVSNVRKFDKLDKIDVKSMKEEEIQKVCNDFESFFLNQILEVSLKSTNVAGEGAGSDIVKGMYTTAIADSSSGRLGISNMLYEFLTQDKK